MECRTAGRNDENEASPSAAPAIQIGRERRDSSSHFGVPNRINGYDYETQGIRTNPEILRLEFTARN